MSQKYGKPRPSRRSSTRINSVLRRPWLVSAIPVTSDAGQAGKLTLTRPPGAMPASRIVRMTGAACVSVASHSIWGRPTAPPYACDKAIEGIPSSPPSIAPAIVPEYVTSSATFWPRLTPERTRSGGWSAMIFLTPMMTQSVGVPFKAKWRGPISRNRSGSLRESEWATPDWSFSGATIVTSSDSSPAINSRSLSPAAWMPSSLVRRIRMGPVFARGVRRGELVLAGKGYSSRGQALLRQRSELRPAVRGPDDGRKLKLGRAGAIAVVIMIGQPIAFGGFYRLLPARPDKAAGRGQQQGAAALQRRFAVFVPVWPLDSVGAADANVVGRGDALAAPIEADEEGELAVMPDNGRGLDRAPMAAGQRDAWRVRADELARLGVEFAELDPGPEGPEG